MHDGIAAWISALRGRHARGAFDGLAPIDLGDGAGSFSVAHTVRIMLNDLDDLDAFDRHHQGNGSTPSADDLEFYRVRRLELLAGFMRLREIIG